MARVKRAVNAHKKRRIVLERASGYRGQRSRLYRKAKEQSAPLDDLRLPGPQGPQGRVPAAVDPADQRRGPRRGHDLQPVHPGPEDRRRRGRPPDAGRAWPSPTRRRSPRWSRWPGRRCPKTWARPLPDRGRVHGRADPGRPATGGPIRPSAKSPVSARRGSRRPGSWPSGPSGSGRGCSWPRDRRRSARPWRYPAR